MSETTSRSTGVRASKFLSLILRHEPEKVGLMLDPAGWVAIDTLLAAVNAHGVTMTRAGLDAIVADCRKQRFALSEDGLRIRANQGHSIEVELGHAATVPPAVLYHGTPVRNLDAIRREGLRRMDRHYVHLSTDAAMTLAVGQRRGKAVLLTVRAGEMAAPGLVFFVTPNGVWLTDAVPPEYIDG